MGFQLVNIHPQLPDLFFCSKKLLIFYHSSHSLSNILNCTHDPTLGWVRSSHSSLQLHPHWGSNNFSLVSYYVQIRKLSRYWVKKVKWMTETLCFSVHIMHLNWYALKCFENYQKKKFDLYLDSSMLRKSAFKLLILIWVRICFKYQHLKFWFLSGFQYALKVGIQILSCENLRES